MHEFLYIKLIIFLSNVGHQNQYQGFSLYYLFVASVWFVVVYVHQHITL
jgi:hypothetical protein